MNHQQRTDGHDAETVFGAHIFNRAPQGEPSPEQCAGDDDSPKHDEAWLHRDEFAEDASPPREEYGKVELEKGFFHKEQRLNLNVMRDDRRFAFA